VEGGEEGDEDSDCRALKHALQHLNRNAKTFSPRLQPQWCKSY